MGLSQTRNPSDSFTTNYDHIRISHNVKYFPEDSDIEQISTDKEKDLFEAISTPRDNKTLANAMKIRQIRSLIHKNKAGVSMFCDKIVKESEFEGTFWGVIHDINWDYMGQIDGKRRRYGLGIQVWKGGVWYEGTWENDEMTGMGRVVKPGKERYEGEWRGNKANGYGCYYGLDGLTYIGDWENNTKHGYGEQTTHEGHRYKGQFRHGKKHGKGKMKLRDGSKYSGEFAEDLYEGQGEYTWPDARVYNGSWKSGAMHGYGDYTWPLFSCNKHYSGEYLAGLKHGFGTFTWADGSQYRGEWSHGSRHGSGIFTSPDRSIRHEIWFEGVLITSSKLE